MSTFNQNPSRVTQMVDRDGEVIITRYGEPAYRLVRIATASSDPIDKLIAAGVLRRPRATSPRSERSLPVLEVPVDVGALLDAERGRLDD